MGFKLATLADDYAKEEQVKMAGGEGKSWVQLYLETTNWPCQVVSNSLEVS